MKEVEGEDQAHSYLLKEKSGNMIAKCFLKQKPRGQASGARRRTVAYPPSLCASRRVAPCTYGEVLRVADEDVSSIWRCFKALAVRGALAGTQLAEAGELHDQEAGTEPFFALRADGREGLELHRRPREVERRYDDEGVPRDVQDCLVHFGVGELHFVEHDNFRLVSLDEVAEVLGVSNRACFCGSTRARLEAFRPIVTQGFHAEHALRFLAFEHLEHHEQQRAFSGAHGAREHDDALIVLREKSRNEVEAIAESPHHASRNGECLCRGQVFVSSDHE